MALGGIDYSSVEFFIQALISEDEAMMAAYLSGDVYLAFAIQSGLAPAHATKETHKTERDMCKTTVLGIGFNMTKFGLAINLSSNLKSVVTEDEAQEFINKFDEAYPNYKSFRDRIGPTYQKDRLLVLQDGLALWGDNDNLRSVGNFRIQGCCAVIMRRAVDYAVEQGLEVIFTLHDALYIQYKVGEEYKMKILADCMSRAFVDVLAPEGSEYSTEAKQIRMDPFAWSPDYEKDSEIVVDSEFKMDVSNIYIDQRAGREYEKFSQYFEKDISDEL